MLGGICTGQLYSKHSISHSITHSIIQDRGNSYIKESFLPQCDYATLLQKCFSITLSCPTRNGRNVWRSISTPPQVESVHTTLTWQNCHPKSQQLWGVVDAWETLWRRRGLGYLGAGHGGWNRRTSAVVLCFVVLCPQVEQWPVHLGWLGYRYHTLCMRKRLNYFTDGIDFIVTALNFGRQS